MPLTTGAKVFIGVVVVVIAVLIIALIVAYVKKSDNNTPVTPPATTTPPPATTPATTPPATTTPPPPATATDKPSTRRATIANCGNQSKDRGWYDLDNSGFADDFCRYLSSGTEEWWSCTKNTDADAIYSSKGAYEFKENKTPYTGGLTGVNCNIVVPESTPAPASTRRKAIGDCGYHDKPRGWFDLDGKGVFNDFCRYVGGSDTEAAWWSCTKASEADNVISEKGKYTFTSNPNPYYGGLLGGAACNIHPVDPNIKATDTTNWAGKAYVNDGEMCGPSTNKACKGKNCCSRYGWCGGTAGGNDEWCGTKLHNGIFDGTKPA